MSNNQNTDHAKQNNQDARTAEAAKANFNQAADKTAEQGKQFADAAREGVNKMVDAREKATETTKQAMQNGIDTASKQVREAADRFSKTLGFSGADSERLAQRRSRTWKLSPAAAPFSARPSRMPPATCSISARSSSSAIWRA
jgi:hypothetical protein